MPPWTHPVQLTGGTQQSRLSTVPGRRLLWGISATLCLVAVVVVLSRPWPGTDQAPVTAATPESALVAAVGSPRPDAAAVAPVRQAHAQGSPWFEKVPSMTASSATSRLLERESRDRSDPCEGLHGNWRH